MGQAIDTRVNDARKVSHCVVVNATGGRQPDLLSPPGIVFKPARYSPKETMTWYVPEPLVKLILYCLSNQAAQ